MMKRKAPEMMAAGGGGSRFGANGFRPRKMCTFFLQGRCTKGVACTYAHSEEELAPQAGQRPLPVIGQARAVPSTAVVVEEEEEEGVEADMAELFGEVEQEGQYDDAAAPAEEEVGAEDGAASLSVLSGPREFPPGATPQQLCPFWMHHPACCEQSDACPMAHGLAELGLEFGDPVEIRTDGNAVSEHPSSGSGGSKGRPISAVRRNLTPSQPSRPPRNPSWASQGGSWGPPQAAAGGKGMGYRMALAMGQDGPKGYGKGGSWGPRLMQAGPMSGCSPQTAPGGMIHNRFTGASFVPTKMCHHWMKDPYACAKGMDCSFAHGVHELQPNAAAVCGTSRFLHQRPPTKYCTFFEKGQCAKGLACTFAHSLEELQGAGASDLLVC